MKVGELFIVLDTKLDRFNKGMSDAERAMVSVGRKFTAIGKNLTKFVTLPILAIGVASVKAFADFDKAMTESLAIMGPISASMQQQMADVAKTISEETVFSANELAESYYFLASAGMTAEQSVAALDKVAKFAQAGAFDLATATDLLTDAQTAMGLSSKDAAINQENLVRVSDVLVGANTLANASVQQFSESLTNMAAAALTNVNKGLEEGVAILAAFADKGIKGQKAGMKLSMMLNALDKAASKNKEAWKKYNIQLWDAEGNMRNVGDIVGDLEVAFKDMTPEAKAAALAQLGFDSRVKNSILSLMGSSEKILQWTEDLKKMGGVTEQVAKKQMEAFSNQLKVVKNMLVNVGAEIGEVLVPVLKNLIDNHIKPAIQWWKDLSDGQKEMIVKVGGLVAALGPLLLVFGSILTVLPKITVAFSALKAGMSKLIPSMATLKGSVSGVSGVLKNLPAIAGAAFVGWKVGDAIGKIELLGKSIDEHLIDGFTNVIDNLGLFQSEAELTGETAEKLAGRVKFLAEHKEKLANMVKNAKEELVKEEKAVEDSTEATEDLDSKTKALSEKFAELRQKAEDLGILKDTRTNVEKLKDEYWDLMGKVFAGEAGWQTFIDQAVDLKDKISELTDGLDDLDMALEDDAEEWIDMGDKANTVLEDLGIGIGSIPEEVEDATTKTKSLWDDMADGMQTKWGSTIGEVLRGATSLKDGLKGMWDAVLTQFTDIIGLMVAKWMVGFVAKIKTGSKEAGNAASTLAGGAASLGTAITSLATGIASILPAIATGIATAAEILFAALPEIAAIAAVALAIYAGFMAVTALFSSISSGGGGMMDATNRELHNIWEEARNILNLTKNMKNITTNIMKSSWKIEKILVAIKNKLGEASGGGSDFSKITAILSTLKTIGWKTNELLRDILGELMETPDVTDVAVQDSHIDIERNNMLNDMRGYLKNIRKFTMKSNVGIQGVIAAIRNISGYQAGGIAWTPQLATVAEHGPEAIIPLTDLSQSEVSGGGGDIDNMNIAIEIEPVVISRGDEYVIEFLQKSIKRGNIKIPISAVGT